MQPVSFKYQLKGDKNDSKVSLFASSEDDAGEAFQYEWLVAGEEK
jgi:hypothetical protein